MQVFRREGDLSLVFQMRKQYNAGIHANMQLYQPSKPQCARFWHFITDLMHVVGYEGHQAWISCPPNRPRPNSPHRTRPTALLAFEVARC